MPQETERPASLNQKTENQDFVDFSKAGEKSPESHNLLSVDFLKKESSTSFPGTLPDQAAIGLFLRAGTSACHNQQNREQSSSCLLDRFPFFDKIENSAFSQARAASRNSGQRNTCQTQTAS